MKSLYIGTALIGLGISLMASLVIGTPLFLALYILIAFALLLIVECASISPGRRSRRQKPIGVGCYLR